ncbi:esterase LipO domain protein [Mycobacterium kansasii]|uniref:Esterase LipO domain protein n=1 Tax=Mycobacterium kansasii TaxID=1768 RepID=A0A1V3WA21_MYCKA|nr:esterase LipO domain protein [Mycobacterium kansasii]
MKRKFSEHRQIFVDASPIHHVRADAPLSLCCTAPTTPSSRSWKPGIRRRIARSLEVPGRLRRIANAQHAFDIFGSRAHIRRPRR